MRDLATKCCNFRDIHFNMALNLCAFYILAVDELSILILMIQDMLFAMFPPKIEIDIWFTR